MANYKWKVQLIESEAGWGQRIDETKYYDDDKEEEAKSFVTEFNSHNDKDYVPSWYMYATDPRRVEIK